MRKYSISGKDYLDQIEDELNKGLQKEIKRLDRIKKTKKAKRNGKNNRQKT